MLGKRVVIVGAGGFGRGVGAWLEQSVQYRSQQSVTDVVYVADSVAQYQLNGDFLGGLDQYIPQVDDRVLVAVAQPAVRRELVAQLDAKNVEYHWFVDDRAVVAPGVEIPAGAIICPGVVVETGVELGQHVHVNNNSVLGHDVVLGDYVTLGPMVNVMGGVRVGAEAFFGGSSAVLPRLEVGERTVIGAGATVVHDVAAEWTVAGTPAIKLH